MPEIRLRISPRRESLTFSAVIVRSEIAALPTRARAEACSLLSHSHLSFTKDAFMVAPVAAYLVAFGTMLFAGLVALTVTAVVKHLDPPERAAEPPVRIPEEIAV